MSENNKIPVLKICPKCKEEKCIKLTREEFNNLKNYYEGDGLIQELLPNVPAPERELLKGGMCGECWTKAFGIVPWDLNDENR